jgi:phosphatidylethanolamine N-methyltransferase
MALGPEVQQPSAIHRILGLQNTDLHRVVDVAVFLLHLHIFLLATFTPSTPLSQFLFVINALVWRLWYTLGIGFLLNRQSFKKSWTRHFIKFGDDVHEAWRQWKGIYHISMHMCYASFVAVAWKMYHVPADWSYGTVLIRHVIGVALISLHVWTVSSIYDSLGEFGWFYGDFFFDQASKLTYDGIYRFLNNPERFLGLAGLWGFAIITYSRAMFALALTSHLLTLFVIQFVERPHMQKLHGESLRRQSGLSKGIRRSLPKPILQLQGTVDRRIEQTADFIDEFIEAARPKLAAGVGTIVRDATALFKNYPAHISITRTADDVAGFDPKQYSLSVEGTPAADLAELDRHSGREGESGREPPRHSSPYRTLMFEYGAPLRVRWSAPKRHGKKDWIGLYMVSDNPDRELTRISSRGRWTATVPGKYDTVRADQGILKTETAVASTSSDDEELVQGEMEFSGDKLWWTTGVFEFRYHHDGKHNVMAISKPFEIRIGKFDEDDVELDASGSLRGAVEQALLPVVRNCFDRDPDIAPNTLDEAFGSLVERDGKYAKRVVFAVHQKFGIEFAPEVVQADGCVKNLAWRICTAKKALVSTYYTG